MKLHEVLKHPEVVSGDKWFRPVGWEKIPVAFCLKEGNTRSAAVYSVPDARGGRLGITAFADELAGEWEVVDSAVVLDAGKVKA